MLKINFYQDSDLKDFSKGLEEYKKFWGTDGKKIVKLWQEVTGLKFRESYINAIVFEGRSFSHPLSLRHNLDLDRKKSVLIHELGHRILAERGTKKGDSLNNHKFLFLVLYDIFVELYNENFAKESVVWDSNLPSKEYKEAWDWALSFSKAERKKKFLEMVIE